jgi:signal transduction histidine kinase/CheY-like chemotaxis protein/HPt (histidine-containing phosphotransfer) domain-containing protein
VRLKLPRHHIRGQLLALFAVLLLAGASVLVLDEVAQYRARQSLESLQEHSLGRLRALKGVADGYTLGVVDTTFKVRNYLIDWPDGVAALDRAQASIDRNWQALQAMPHGGGQHALFLQAAQARQRADRAAARLRAILQRRDIGELGRFADTELYPAIDPVTTRLQSLSDMAMVEAEAVVRADVRRAYYTSALRIGLSLLAFLVAAIAGRRILSNAYRGIEGLTRLAHRMREHDYVAAPGKRPRGELGEVMDAFLDMRADVLRFETELTDQLVRNEQVRDQLEQRERILQEMVDAAKRLENELRESEARAHEANHAKSAFLASMSHEIRTPMIGVTGMVEVLAHTRLDADQRRALNIIQSSAHSLLQIIGDILDFSKIEAGRLDLQPAATRLSRVLQGAVANFSGSASSKGLTLGCQVDERIAAAHYADALRLRQILSNFLSNAIKFTERGSVQATLEWRGSSEVDGEVRDHLCFSVADTGIGIDPRAQARLFQPFAQADAETTRRFGGTGLGLAICRRLAQLMGGEVAMESVAGLGTTMRLMVDLPRAPLAEVAAEPVPAGASADFALRSLPSVEDAERERSLVLLVDDHPTNRLVIARQLALAGFASEAAEDGESGLEAWRSGRYALLLSDVHMPRMDGYELARRIRAEETGHGLERTPIVALTASALKGEAERCLAAGMDDYLAKPVSIASLAAALQRWLPHVAGPAPGSPDEPERLPQLEHPPPLDPAVLDALAGGNPGEVRALLDDFLASTALDIAELESAREAGEFAEITRQAHKIKGAARMVGAVELAQSADLLEGAARAGDWPLVAPLATDLVTAVERLRRHVAERYCAPLH